MIWSMGVGVHIPDILLFHRLLIRRTAHDGIMKQHNCQDNTCGISENV